MPTFTRGLLSSTALTNIGLVSASVIAMTGSALALPTDGHVVGGQATIAQTSATQLDVSQQSNRAVIDWQSFSIGKNETTNFHQPDASAVAFNRVVGVDPSTIMGHLNANGQVVLVNPNGVLFTKSAQVNVGGLVASTSGFSNANAMAGRMVFDQPGNPNASIVNEGHISAKAGGLAALVAPSVVNSGVIEAKVGKVALASGDKWTLDLYGDRLVNFAMNDKVKGEVTNSGRISADGGTVQITANVAKDVVSNAVNMSGVIEANSVSQSGGSILLAAVDGSVAVTGRLEAKGVTGGTVQVTGDSVALNGARIDVSGDTAGGTVEIGGGLHGAGSLEHARTVTADTATDIKANARTVGNGGTVAVWSDGDTQFAGRIAAKGGATGGNGGTIETSGHTLDISGANVDASAVAGNAGTWVLDPYSLTISASGAAAIDNALVNNNVLVQTSASNTGASPYGSAQNNAAGDIIVASNINWASNNSLILDAYHDISVNAQIVNTGNGNVTLRADNSSIDSGNVVLGASGGVSTGGAVSFYYSPATYALPNTYNIGQIAAGQGFNAYMLVNNAADLAKVNNNLQGTYALGTNISAVGNIAPIGGVTPFSGLFDGNGGLFSNYKIDGVTASSENYAGLFGANSGTIRNVALTNVSVTGTSNVGGLVGFNTGSLINDSVSGEVDGLTNANHDKVYNVGGMAGYNSGLITAGKVSGKIYVNNSSDFDGGFVGFNTGTILNGSFSGAVTVGCDFVGGFVGENTSTGYISGSSATGSVSNGGGGYIGGFAGLNAGQLIDNSALAMNVTVAPGNHDVGGFVGSNTVGGYIQNGRNSGTVNGSTGIRNLGGFAGSNIGGTIVNALASDQVLVGSGATGVGGFVGYNSGTLINDKLNALAITVGNNATNVGGYVGENASGTISGQTVVSRVVAGNNSTNIGGFAGYNLGVLSHDAATVQVLNGAESLGTGGLVGRNDGTVECALVNGTVRIDTDGADEGGVIGTNYGSVTSSGFSGTVQAGCVNIGGFVGANYGTVAGSYAIGTVTNAGGGVVGGFAGLNALGGMLQQVVANEIVSVVQGNDSVGGLVGRNDGTVSGGLAYGSVIAGITANDGSGQVATFGTASNNVGGLVGYNTGFVQDAFSGNYVNLGYGAQNVGGLVGQNYQGTIVNGMTTSPVSVGAASSFIGGFVGNNQGSVAAGSVGTGPSAALLAEFQNDPNCNCDLTGVIAASTAVSGANASQVIAGNGSRYVGGFAGYNSTLLSGATAGNQVTVGNAAYGVGGLVGYNVGSVANGLFTGSVTAGSQAMYVAGGVGWNDAGATISGLAVNGYITAGSQATAVGGLVGLNGSDRVNKRGRFLAQAATLSSGAFNGTVAAGTNSFAVGGLEGWDSKWTEANSGTGTVYYGAIADGMQGGAVDVTGTGVVTAGAGSTFIHDANHIGCDERPGGNCYGAAGQEIINIKADDKSKVYGSNDPALTYAVTGSVNGYSLSGIEGTVNFSGLESGDQLADVLMGGITRDPGEDVGGYAIRQGTLGLNPENTLANLDYAVSFTNGTLSITPASLIVTANAQQKLYGSADPALTYQISGLVNGDTSSVLGGALDRDAGENVGNYMINQGTVAPQQNSKGNVNYTINYIGNDLTITPAELLVTADPKSRGEGEPNPPFSATFAGLTNGDTSSVVTNLMFSTNASAGSSAGQYNIYPQATVGVPAGGTVPNYFVVYQNGILTITPAPAVTASTAGIITPLTGGTAGNIVPLTSTIGQVANIGNQITCLKVNLEIRGITTDSPIDCSSPLLVNGF